MTRLLFIGMVNLTLLCVFTVTNKFDREPIPAHLMTLLATIGIGCIILWAITQDILDGLCHHD